MTRDEAKLLLQVYRPGGPDTHDPRFAEALALAGTDPELAAWFAQEQAFDAAVSRSLKETPIPANLKLAILAGAKVLELLPWWRLVHWRALAAFALVLFTGAGFFLFSLSRTQSMVAASLEMLQFANQRTAHLAQKTNDLAQMRQFLTRCHAPADFSVPPGLRRFKVLGCSVLAWQDQTAALICFHIGGSQHLKLFVTDRPADADLPPEGEVKMIEYDDWAAALWSEKDKTYLLAGKVHPASLRRFLL